MFVDHSKSLTDEMDSFDGAAEIARIRSGRVLDRNGKPKAKRGSPERSVQITLRRYMEQVLPGCIVAAVENERKAQSTNPHSIARFHAARKAAGTVPGFPDLIVLLPEGRSFLVEVKAPKGSLNENQRELHPRIRAIGHTVIVAKSIEQLRDGLRAAGVQTREAR